MAEAIALDAAHIEIALDLAGPVGYTATITARVEVARAEAPKPWIARATSNTSPLVAKPPTRLDRVKIAKPHCSTGLRPYRSLARAASSMKPPRLSK